MKLDANEFKARVNAAEAMQAITEFMNKWDFGEGQVDIKISRTSKTIGHKALFWIWMRQLAENFTNRGDESYTAEQMHDLMCHKFLGYTNPVKLGSGTTIRPALKTITYPQQLTGADFGHFLSLIDAWAQSVGVFLITQDNSDYSDWKEANQ